MWKSMWRANKWGIIALLAGGAILSGVHFYLRGSDKLLADQVLSAGTCALLFLVALCSWISVRKRL